MAARIWIHSIGRKACPEPKVLSELLLNCGVAACELDRDVPSGPGVVFFEEMSSGLCDFVRGASHQGLERVLAVGLSRGTLEKGVWSLLQAGASDVLTFEAPDALATEVAERFKRWHEVDRIVDSSLVRKNLVGRSPAWISSMRQIVEVARFSEASVLVLGESGTGKELAARLIHTLDPRPNKKELVIMDCTTIVPALSGSEFFGHERGAFTGAVGPRDGGFALAHGGTLFLDEVGELPLELQAQLLRAVQERTYKRVGGNTWHQADFRLVCATNRDLLQEVARSRFRHDLYYRIASAVIRLPPLRERIEDIPLLVDHFLGSFRGDGTAFELDVLVRRFLMARSYPGNVRDLARLVAGICQRHVGAGPITVGSIPQEERPSIDSELEDWRDESLENAVRRALAMGVGLKEIGRSVEETAVHIAVCGENGNLQNAARKLGVTDRALQMRRAARRQSEKDLQN